MFKVGQEVVCIRGATAEPGTILKAGEIYVVYGVQDACCSTNIFVGFNFDPLSGFWTRCGSCGEQIGENGEWWHNSNRFVSLEEFNSSNEAIEELMDEMRVG